MYNRLYIPINRANSGLTISKLSQNHRYAKHITPREDLLRPCEQSN